MAANARAASQNSEVKKVASHGKSVVSRTADPDASTSRHATMRSPIRPAAAASSASTISSQSKLNSPSRSPTKPIKALVGNASREGARAPNNQSSGIARSSGLAPSTSSTSLIRPSPNKTPSRPAIRTQDPTGPTGTLQLAAQAHSWLYMTSTLETNAQKAEQAATHALEARTEELAKEEADIADARIRFETERLIALYEELTDPTLSSSVPRVTQGFILYEAKCNQTITEALQLSAQNLDEFADIKSYNEVLNRLDDLLQESGKLQDRILSITQTLTSSQGVSRVNPTLLTLLPVIRAHAGNLTSARTLVDRCKENLGASVAMLSLQLDSPR